MRRTVALVPALSLALAATLTSCSAASSSHVVSAKADVDTSAGLVIDGERIADRATWEAAQEQKITVYTGYQEANQQAFNDTFTADTGIEVEYVRDVANKLSERIQSEAGAGQLGADVIITSDYKVARELTEAGILTPHVPATVGPRSDLVLDEGHFTTFANVVITFAYNTHQVSEEDAPTSWADLLDPAYEGRIGLTSGTAGGSSIALNRFLAEEVAPDFWDKLAEQEPTIYDSGGQRQEALARSELMLATAGTAAVNVAVAEDAAPLEYVVPEEGLVLFSFFIAEAADSANPEAAEVFINYALSKRGQSVISAVGDYPAREDVDPPTANGRALPPLDSPQVWRMKPEDELTYADVDAEVWREAFGR